MEAIPGILVSLIEKVEAYIVTNSKLHKLELTHATTGVMLVVAFKLLLIVLISILFNVSSSAVGLRLGELLGNTYSGFFALSILYLVLIFVLHLFFQKWIKRINSVK